jgi:hypothetical protein
MAPGPEGALGGCERMKIDPWDAFSLAVIVIAAFFMGALAGFGLAIWERSAS